MDKLWADMTMGEKIEAYKEWLILETQRKSRRNLRRYLRRKGALPPSKKRAVSEAEIPDRFKIGRNLVDTIHNRWGYLSLGFLEDEVPYWPRRGKFAPDEVVQVSHNLWYPKLGGRKGKVIAWRRSGYNEYINEYQVRLLDTGETRWLSSDLLELVGSK